MRTNTTKKTPKLRFREFSDEWQERKLEDVGQNIIGLTYSPKNVVAEGGIIVLRSSNIKNDRLSLANQVRVDSKIPDKLIVRDNDILICTRNGSQRLIGKNILLKETEKPMTFGAFMSAYRSDINNFNIFLFNTQGYSKQIQMNLGARINQITTGYLNKFKFYYPQVEEQEKIAEFLTITDDKISALQKKKELLEKYKKGLMQKIFPTSRKGFEGHAPEIRFKDENSEDYPAWEERKLGDMDIYVADGNYGEMYPKASEMLPSGVPFIRANNLKNGKLVWNDMKYISPALHAELKSGHLKPSDILISTRGEIGTLAFVANEFDDANINAQLCLLRVSAKTNSRYLFQYLLTRQSRSQFKKLQTGSALKQLPKGKLALVKIHLPAEAEQQKIADFLTSIDEKIEAEERKLEQAKQFKKSLLQQMFV